MNMKRILERGEILKEYIMYIDTGISVTAEDELSAMQIGREEFFEMVKKNQYDIYIDEVIDSKQ